MIGAFKLNTLAAAISAGGPTLANYSFSRTLNNPNPFGTSAGDRFGWSTAIGSNHYIVGAPREDATGLTDVGKAYIYNTSGTLLWTLSDPTTGSVTSDFFGYSVAINDTYSIVGAPGRTVSANASAGVAYVYSNATGSLVYTFNDANAYSTAAGDSFGISVAISGNYAIVGAYFEDSAAGNSSGAAYIYSLSTGTLLWTLTNPNVDTGSASDQFGQAVAITDTYAIIGAPQEDDVSYAGAGKAYIYSISTGSLVYTLNNPSSQGTPAGDNFGSSVAISSSYAIVGAPLEDDITGGNAGKAYVFSLSTGSLLYTLNNANSYTLAGDPADQFGFSVAINDTYAVVGAPYEDSLAAVPYGSSGAVYIYNMSDGSLATSLLDPNAYGVAGTSYFGYTVSVSGNRIITGTWAEDDAGSQGDGEAGGPGASSGKAYIYSRIVSEQTTPTSTGIYFVNSSVATSTSIAIPAGTQAGDIAVLFDMSSTVTNIVPSGWTSINGVTTTGIRTNISYRVLTAGQSGTSVTGMGTTTRKAMLVFRNAASTTPTITVSTVSSQATTVAPTNQTITGGTAPCIYFAVYAKTTTTVPARGFTGTTYAPGEVSSVSTSGIYAKYLVYSQGANAITPETATVTMTDAGTNTLQSFYINIT